MSQGLRLVQVGTVAFLLPFALALEIKAQQGAIIRGYVRNAEKNEPIPRANVLVRGTTIGAATNENGFYEIKEVPQGEYRLEARVIGYKKQIRGTIVRQGDVVQLDFGLIQTAIELNEITVEGRKADFRKDPMPTVRIELKDIKRLVPTTTADIIKEVPGVSTSRSGGWGTKPYLQGMTDSRILVLIDGVKVNQACPLGMDACTATLDPDMIENVEVHKGPGSAQYGSGNMGGVVNISTISSNYITGPGFRTETSFVGKYKSVSNSSIGKFSFSGGNDKFDFVTSIGRSKYGDYDTREGVIENSGFESSSIHLKTRYRPGNNQQLLFTTQVYRANDIGWPASNTIIPEEKRNTYALNYAISDLAEKLRMIQLTLSYQPMRHNMVSYLLGREQSVGDSKSDTYNAGVKTYWRLGSEHSITVGGDYSLWRMNSRRSNVDNGERLPYIDILPNSFVGELGTYIQDEFEISKRLRTQIGLRANYVSSGAEEATESIIAQDVLQTEELIASGSAALVYSLEKDIALNASVSKGFKAATPVERYIAAPMLDGYYRVGNPDLTSEVNFSKRIGLRGMRNRFNWGVELYRNNLSNLISAEVDSGITSSYLGLKGVRRYVNIMKADVYGGSAFVGISITGSLFISTNLSYDLGQDKKADEPLPGISPLQSITRITYDNTAKGYWLELAAKAADGQDRYARRYGEKSTPAYTVFDIRGGWEVKEGIELSVGIENIFNKYYRDHLNQALLPEPGRNMYVEVTFPFPSLRNKNEKGNFERTKQVLLSVEGMACQYCVKTVNERLKALPGVISSTVSLEEKTADVIIREDVVSLSDLVDVIELAGFEASLISVKSSKTGKNK